MQPKRQDSSSAVSAVSAVDVLASGPGAEDRRQAAAIGRQARLELVFSYRRGRTLLAHAYAEPPFRVGRSLDAGPYAQVIVACTGPGVFGGDALEQHVVVERGARVILVSQAALQIHPAATGGAASLRSRFEVEQDGELDAYWDALIPFAGACLSERIDLDLAEGSRAFWSDAFMSGRIGRGEAWRFEELGREMRVRIGGSLQYLERYRVRPASRPVEAPWMAGTAQYFGTLLAHDPEATSACAERLHHALASEEVRAGVDRLGPALVAGRLLARRGPPFAAARAAFRAAFARPPLRRL